MAVPLLSLRREWWCPNCTVMDVTERADVHTRYHTCGGLNGVLAPMLERHERAHVVAVEREDYERNEAGLRRDQDGRPVMAVHKLTDDSQSCWVFAPTAVGSVRVQ